MKVAIIGGGAAGFFAAIHVKENHPNAEVIIFEKSKKLLAKVKISGGGRCNVTNGCKSISELSKAYPRGEKKLKKAFRIFNTQHTWDWFTKRNVPLTLQEDGCVFPVSQDSQSIIDCFLHECKKHQIKIITQKNITSLKEDEQGILLNFKNEEHPLLFQKVIVATGGSPKLSGLEWLSVLGHEIIHPVPSLFTFNMPSENITKLMGIVVENAQVRIQGTKIITTGPLLITHWGMSGPAILKASAFGARILSEKNYQFHTQVNWVNIQNNEEVLSKINHIIQVHNKKNIGNFRPFLLPERLWHFLLKKLSISLDKKWGEIGKKGANKIVNILTHDIYQVNGKTTFKEEFVTCGGVSLDSINFNTMESKVIKNLYFTGEVIDVDGITGGYNFQAAWTTAFIAGKLL